METTKRITSESGMVQIVEATFVFPIMFLILVFLIYMGNAYYLKSQVEAIVNRKAIEGASYCADPILSSIKKNNTIPQLPKSETEESYIKPYRYLVGGMKDVTYEIGRQVKAEFSSSKSLFSNMGLVLKTPQGDIAHYNNYILYSTFSVEIKCCLEFPVKYFGQKTPYVMTMTARSEVAVNDTAEFIRNTDMVIDYLGDTKLFETIRKVFDKVNGFITSFAEE